MDIAQQEQYLNELKEHTAESTAMIQELEQKINEKKVTIGDIKRVRRAFFQKKRGFLRRHEEPVDELQEYVLVLMKDNGHTEFLEGVQPGEFLIKSQGTGREKSIMLSAKHLQTFNYNKQYFKGWVAHENNASPYPQEPLFLAEIFRQTIQRIALNFRDVNESKLMEAKTKQIVTFVVIGIIALYVLYIMAKNGNWFGGETVAAVEATKQAITQNATTPPGVVLG